MGEQRKKKKKGSCDKWLLLSEFILQYAVKCENEPRWSPKGFPQNTEGTDEKRKW